jgi:hypothetical protein
MGPVPVVGGNWGTAMGTRTGIGIAPAVTCGDRGWSGMTIEGVMASAGPSCVTVVTVGVGML